MEPEARALADELIAEYPRQASFIQCELHRFLREPGSKNELEWYSMLRRMLLSDGKKPASWGPPDIMKSA